MENHYKILGTTARASRKTIKERYIEKVKEFPPESHPEEFQKIRAAYDVLKDPHRRRIYDVQRQHGGSVQEILDKAHQQMEDGRPEKAKMLLEKALVVDPESLKALFFLGSLHFREGQFQEFEELFSEAYEGAPGDDKGKILATRAQIALNNDEPEMALDVLETIKSRHPRELEFFAPLFFDVYQELDMEEDIWRMAQERVDLLPGDTWEADHWPAYYNWLKALILTNNWSLKGKVMSRVKKFLKNTGLPEITERRILEELWEMYEDAMDSGEYRHASVSLDLLKVLKPKDPEFLKESARLSKGKKLADEMDSIQRDLTIFPLVRVAVYEMYLMDYFPEKYMFSMETILDARKTFEDDDAEFAYGLSVIKKKFKAIYHEYWEKLDALFEERRGRLNRQERRRIKY